MTSRAGRADLSRLVTDGEKPTPSLIAEGADADPSRLQRVLPAAIVIGALGPYLGGSLGVRTEQIVVYGFASLATLLVLGGRRFILPRRLAGVVFGWMVIGLLTVANTAAPPGWVEDANVSWARLLSVVDNFALPLALTGCLVFLLSQRTTIASEVVPTIARWVVLGLVLNTLIVWLSTLWDLSGVMQNFWSNPDTLGDGASVAERAALGGRIGGVFNQPYEAGLSYALAVACWLYLSRTVWAGRYVLLASSGVALLAGGIAASSKVFVYGVPIVLIAWVLASARGRRARTAAAVLLVVISAALIAQPAGDALGSTGLDNASRWLQAMDAEDPISVVTGGRISDEFSVITQRGGLSQPTVAGVGYNATTGALDDGVYAVMVGAGVIGLAAYVMLFAVVLHSAQHLPRRAPERQLLVGVTLLVIVANAGSPPLYVNRASTLVWLIIVPLVALVPSAQRWPHAPVEEGRAGWAG